MQDIQCFYSDGSSAGTFLFEYSPQIGDVFLVNYDLVLVVRRRWVDVSGVLRLELVVDVVE